MTLHYQVRTYAFLILRINFGNNLVNSAWYCSQQVYVKSNQNMKFLLIAAKPNEKKSSIQKYAFENNSKTHFN